MTRVLVTGASSGFGYLTSLALARRGDRVFATMRDPSDRAAADIARIADDEGLALTVHGLDVTATDQVDHLITELFEQAGGIDVLINNAGFAVHGPIETISDAEILSQFDTNVFGVTRTVRAAAPHMRQRGSGTIINLSSLTGFVGAPFQGAYSATKHAVEALSEALRFELAPYGVHVVVIEPGSYHTGFASNTLHTQAFGSQHPLHVDYQRFFTAWFNVMHHSGRADPTEVVDEILDAIDNPGARFRRIVGADAKRLYELKRQNSQEDFEQHMRGILKLDALTGTG